MAGTRTAPTVDATPDGVNVTLHFIDASGDVITEQLPIDIARTDPEIDAWAAAYQDGTNASLWKITKTNTYEGAKDADNAVAAYRGSVKLGINLLFKDPIAAKTESVRWVAPVADIMQGNQDIPLLSDAIAVAFITATLVLLPSYNMQQGQYTGRRERSNNPVINT